MFLYFHVQEVYTDTIQCSSRILHSFRFINEHNSFTATKMQHVAYCWPTHFHLLMNLYNKTQAYHP